jgi:hypothetical protein
MTPDYRHGGDAYDIVRDPNLIMVKLKCSRCGRSWQNRFHISDPGLPMASRCPTCGGLLINYQDYQEKLRRKGSWRLFVIELGIVALLGLAGFALFHFFDFGLIRNSLTLALSILTLYLAFAMRDRRVYDETGCFAYAGDIWPSKAGFLLILVVGLLFLGLFINGIFHLF